VGPQRARLFLIECVLGIGIAAGVMILLEMLDTSVHHLNDLKTLTTAELLGTIPQIVTAADRSYLRRRRIKGVVIFIILLTAVYSASRWIATDNEQLVRILFRPAPNSQSR
jgi:hypothetical protein